MSTKHTPSQWNLKTLIEHWHAHLQELISSGSTDLPFERLVFQSQSDPAYGELIATWEKMPAEEKEAAWQQMLSFAEKGKDDMMPICVRCGTCCEKGGPTLTLDDLELVQSEEVPWTALVTLRTGEPVHSHATGDAFFLTEEKIKIRERTGIKSCVLYAKSDKSCRIHEHKPLQCRAQACWDPTLAEQQATEESLQRKHIFEGVGPILELIEEHDRRCSFDDFRKALEVLDESQGKNVDDILNILAFDEHVRVFAQEHLGLPAEIMDLIFGQSLSTRVRLFGLHVIEGEDGSRTLLPLEKEEA